MRLPPGLLGARHPRAAVVAERRHHFDLIQRQRAFRIVDETLAGRPQRAALWTSIARILPPVPIFIGGAQGRSCARWFPMRV